MNTQYLSRKSVTFLAAIGALSMVSATAQADWLSPAFYGDDLDRCAVELRTELNTAGATSLQHTVTDIDKVGVWFVFDIETNIVDETGAVIRRAKTRCKSNRFREQMVVEVKYQSRISNARHASAN